MKRAFLLAFWLGVVALLLMVLGPWQEAFRALYEGNRVVARVDGASIRQNSVVEGLQASLWRQGEAWHRLAPEVQQQRREEVLGQLVVEQLIHTARLKALAGAVAADEELHWFQRQLGFAETRYAEALKVRRSSEEALRSQMESLLLDQAWVESSIAPQLAAITDVEARTWFEAHRDQMKVWVASRAAHLFLSSHDPSQPDRRPKIEKLSAQLQTGEVAFEQLVDDHSEDERSKRRAGDLGWFTQARMPEDFMAAVERLQPGQISGPVQTRLGWHLIKLLERKPARQLTFEEAREEVIALLRNDRRTAAVNTLIKDLHGRAQIRYEDAALGEVVVPE